MWYNKIDFKNWPNITQYIIYTHHSYTPDQSGPITLKVLINTNPSSFEKSKIIFKTSSVFSVVPLLKNTLCLPRHPQSKCVACYSGVFPGGRLVCRLRLNSDELELGIGWARKKWLWHNSRLILLIYHLSTKSMLYTYLYLLMVALLQNI